MKFYFIRHGHPDYKLDCLTELGRLQAEKASERLCKYGIEEIYSSKKGRAIETAEYTAKRLGLPIVECEYMNEIGWRSVDGEPILKDGHPWDVSDAHAADGISLADTDWRQKDPYCRSIVVERVEKVIKGFDGLMAELGYQREGEYYRVVGENTNKTVAMFSHAGSSSAAISHLLNIPFPQICGFMKIDFTSIICFEFSDKQGELTYPKLTVCNDALHIRGLDIDNVYGN